MSDAFLLRRQLATLGQHEKKRHQIIGQIYKDALPPGDSAMNYCRLVSDSDWTSQLKHVNVLNDIKTLGNDYSNRIGRQIFCKNITLRGTMMPRRQAQGTTNNELADHTVCRTMLVWDKCPNGRKFILEDLLIPTNNGTDLAFNSTSQLNLNFRERFKVLYDKTTTLGFWRVPAAASNGESCKPLKIYKRINRRTTYGPVITEPEPNDFIDITTGALYLITLGDAVAETEIAWSNGGELQFASRVRYTDV